MILLKECIQLLIENEISPKGYCYYVNKNELLVWRCNDVQNYIMSKSFLNSLKSNIAIDKQYTIVDTNSSENEKYFNKYVSHNIHYSDILKTLKQNVSKLKNTFTMYAKIKDQQIKKLVINSNEVEKMFMILISFFEVVPNKKVINEYEKIWNKFYYDGNVVKKLANHDEEELTRYSYKNKFAVSTIYNLEHTTQKMLLELKETFDTLFGLLDTNIRYSIEDIQSIIVQLGLKMFR